VTRRTFLSFTTLAALAACHRTATQSDSRCAFCGMRISRDSHWAAGATAGDGHVVAFDTPGCLFRYRFSPRGTGLRDAWITEYYGRAGARTPAGSVRFVVGSDVVGPMGPDLVPVDRARVDAFVRDHHAREAFDYDAVNADVVSRL
jgi:hypothetical protein